jgi:hypothetical protein
MGRGGLLGGTTTREHVLASGYLELVEQLDVATFALREESWEVDRLRLSIAAVKREMAAVELATVKA